MQFAVLERWEDVSKPWMILPEILEVSLYEYHNSEVIKDSWQSSLSLQEPPYLLTPAK